MSRCRPNTLQLGSPRTLPGHEAPDPGGRAHWGLEGDGNADADARQLCCAGGRNRPTAAADWEQEIIRLAYRGEVLGWVIPGRFSVMPVGKREERRARGRLADRRLKEMRLGREERSEVQGTSEETAVSREGGRWDSGK
jgi:hypothetical protein